MHEKLAKVANNRFINKISEKERKEEFAANLLWQTAQHRGCLFCMPRYWTERVSCRVPGAMTHAKHTYKHTSPRPLLRQLIVPTHYIPLPRPCPQKYLRQKRVCSKSPTKPWSRSETLRRFLRKLKKFGVGKATLVNFYWACIESILTFSITAWYSSLTENDKKRLGRISYTA